MEDELNGVVPCSSLAVESTIRVGTVTVSQATIFFSMISPSESFFFVIFRPALYGAYVWDRIILVKMVIRSSSFDNISYPLILVCNWSSTFNSFSLIQAWVASAMLLLWYCILAILLWFLVIWLRIWDCSILAFVRSEIAFLVYFAGKICWKIRISMWYGYLS